MVADDIGCSDPAPPCGDLPDVVTRPGFVLRLDPGSGLVHSTIIGFWDVEQADLYTEDLTRFVQAAQARFGTATVMVDRRAAGVQREDVMDRYRELNRSIYAEGDHLAIIVSSNLAKLQMRRSMDARWSKAFLSEQAAYTWLSAFIRRA